MIFSKTSPPELVPAKINIGCGFDKRAGYLNVDSDPACNPDWLIENNDLSDLPQAHFEEALALDVLEHIPRAYTMSALFDWAALLKPQGRIFVETSYIFGIIDRMRQGGDFETIHNWKVCLFGNQVHPGDWHCNGFTEKTLRVYLRAVGLTEDNIEVREGWLLRSWATKVEDWTALAAIEDYQAFLAMAYSELLHREPEPFRLAAVATAPRSPERAQEIKTLVCSEERLYKLGAALDAVSENVL